MSEFSIIGKPIALIDSAGKTEVRSVRTAELSGAQPLRGVEIRTPVALEATLSRPAPHRRLVFTDRRTSRPGRLRA